MTEWKKYAMRFGLIVSIVLLAFFLLPDKEKMEVAVYKTLMTTLAIGLAELIWVFFFKPAFRKSEDLPVDEKMGVLIFRGLLYGAIILALTLGL